MYVDLYIKTIYIYIIDIYLDVAIVVTQEFRSSFRLLLQTTEIMKNVKPYAPGEKICKLCLQEKFSILISKPSLNKRTEIFGHCVLRKQFLLNNINEQYTPPASQQQQRKHSTNQQLSRLKKEPKGASKLLSHDNDNI